MRHLKMMVALAVTAFALAVTAVPAMAHDFVASQVGISKGKGFEQIPPPAPGELREYNPARMQNFKFGNFKIRCYGAKSEGQVTELVSETFTTTTKYTSCGWYPQENSLHTTARFSASGIKVTYHANGYLEALGNGSEEEIEVRTIGLAEVAAAIKIGNKICTVKIPEQTIPARAVKKPGEEFSAAVFGTFLSGGHKRLLIENEWKGIRFIYSGGGAQCTAEEFESKQEGLGGTQGRYDGNLEEFIAKGDLSFQ